ncbi:MAG: hypothetical protein CMB80_00065 [Flammeovirgaceae bacterium]|nr:hypothetical protein [Flammeovirgaceae bacterium]|tara:strand:+ start:5511 stop:5831 length:321 start_codon:yes stop_codon:yes gene_type:complete
MKQNLLNTILLVFITFIIGFIFVSNVYVNNLRKQIYEQEILISEIQENQKFTSKELVRIETRINNLEKGWSKIINSILVRIETLDKEACHGFRYEDLIQQNMKIIN